MLNDAVATETLVLTRPTTGRLFDFAFRLARKRKAQGHPGLCTCVDKANVFAALAVLRRIFDERATAMIPEQELAARAGDEPSPRARGADPAGTGRASGNQAAPGRARAAGFGR